ncbi:peptidase M48 family protein [Sphingomonas panacisoli]|uniref:Peptidase M48 family protein n=1 Tax=Sphingomonas panacisoli TaxID=1813879 RepID=A0A5B8LIJ0_9SPHN|nr:M48 family metallopeptidase [Sphingomonas panacisoli]QDZ06970.1 peptidase M48 family protein [Sphingomonas panacisoli]
MKLFVLAALAAIASTPADSPNDAFFGVLRNADTRLATIAERLTIANVELCDQRQPALGMVLHSLRQYRESDWPTVKRVFGFRAPVAVEGVIDGGAAQGAGVAANDAVLAIGDHPLPSAVADGSKPASTDRDRALALIDSTPSDRPLAITFDHDGQTVRRELAPRVACKSRFEIVIGNGYDAQADGTIVQLGEKFFEGMSDEEIAVVVAHEFAHNILRHRARLDAAGISRGIAAEFGRNARLIRETEDQADELSVYLLANAGYDPLAPGRFWRKWGGKIGTEGIFRSRTHASGKSRAKAMDVVAKTAKPSADQPIIPAMLSARSQPLR